MICQLYRDGTVVQFTSFDLLPGTNRHGQLEVLSVPSLPQLRHQDVRRRFYLLAIRGPTCGEGMPGIEPGSSDPHSSSTPPINTNTNSLKNMSKLEFKLWEQTIFVRTEGLDISNVYV